MRLFIENKLFIPILCTAFILCLINHAGAEIDLPRSSIGSNAEYVQDEIIVMFDDSCTRAQIDEICLNLCIVEIQGMIPGRNIYLLRIPDYKSVEEVINEATQYSEIIHAEPNYKSRSNRVPDDTYFSVHELYGLEKIGAQEAWDTITDAGPVIVAVFDAGVDYDHPDLANNIWVNDDDPIDGIDNDDNGYADDIHGWNFIHNNNDPGQIDSMSHGTLCAGIIGAVGNNGGGITGVCWRVKIMPLTVASESGAYLFSFINAVYYAINNGAKIINYSYGSAMYSAFEERAIQEANDAGILFITAAGNYNLNIDIFPDYPSQYDCENIITVGATDENDDKAWFSNYGVNTVDIAAPGDSVLSTINAFDIDNVDEPRNYGVTGGTSFAAPYVAGACALVWADNTDLTHLEVKDKILGGADSLGSLGGLIAGGRRLNVNGALAYIRPPDPIQNLISSATVIASSYHGPIGAFTYEPRNAMDGIYGAWDVHEWASDGEMTPWIRFNWNPREPQTINKIVLYDRCNPVDHIADAWLYLNRGGSTVSAIHLGMFPYGGAAKEVVFDPVTVDEIYIDIVSGWGLNVGLSEVQAYYDPAIESRGNLIRTGSATVDASSHHAPIGAYTYEHGNAMDGIYGAWDVHEWASDGEMDPWIRFNWSAPQTINKIVLYDRCNPVDHILDAWLYLNRGGSTVSAIHLGMFPYGGAAKEVIFDPVTVDEIYIDIVAGAGLNIGLSEVEAYYDPAVESSGNLIPYACAVAASTYHSPIGAYTYEPGNAMDRIYGAWDVHEWASDGEMTPWIAFRWCTPRTINKIVLYDRCNPVDHILDAWLILDRDGVTVQEIHLGMFPFGGAAKEVIFDPVSVDTVYVIVTDGWGLNVGLSEVEAYYE